MPKGQHKSVALRNDRIIALFTVEGFTIPAIAETYGLRNSTVRSILKKAGIEIPATEKATPGGRSSATRCR